LPLQIASHCLHYNFFSNINVRGKTDLFRSPSAWAGKFSGGVQRF
jgi:hypothetical protein